MRYKVNVYNTSDCVILLISSTAIPVPDSITASLLFVNSLAASSLSFSNTFTPLCIFPHALAHIFWKVPIWRFIFCCARVCMSEEEEEKRKKTFCELTHISKVNLSHNVDYYAYIYILQKELTLIIFMLTLPLESTEPRRVCFILTIEPRKFHRHVHTRIRALVHEAYDPQSNRHHRHLHPVHSQQTS